MKPIKKILIIRFRQIGDSILAVALCSTLKKSFPDAEIHFVLNKNIASLYEGHPDIDKVITFDKNENKPFTAYTKQIRCHHRYAFYDPDSFFLSFFIKNPFPDRAYQGIHTFAIKLSDRHLQQ